MAWVSALTRIEPCIGVVESYWITREVISFLISIFINFICEFTHDSILIKDYSLHCFKYVITLLSRVHWFPSGGAQLLDLFGAPYM